MTRDPHNERLFARPVPRPDPRTAARATTMLRKPRVLIAGEFSSGKTQLVTGLLGEAVLPSNVTSTALPPVWLLQGSGPRLAVGPDGAPREVAGIEGFDVTTTQYGILSHRAPILETVEIIDTPGNSDPNIPAETWQRMVAYADMVIWCTNATQAWRQSEKSVWLDMPEALRRSATLVITHADRMPDQRSADRVLRRVRREAEPFFAHILLASLISETDIARLSAHLAEVAGGLARRPGVENNVVAAAAVKAASAPREGAPRDGAARPRPRSVRSAPTAAAAEGPSTAHGMPLREVGASDWSATTGRARQLWHSLGGHTLPSDDPAAILDRVDRLLELLDRPAGGGEDPPGNIFDDLLAPQTAPSRTARLRDRT